LDFKFEKRILVTLITIFLSNSVFSQNFKGIITNNEGNPIDDCYVLLINSASEEVINYAVPNVKGEYFINIHNKKLTNVKIKCQGLAYKTETQLLKIDKELANYIVNFKLTSREIKLDEVIVIFDRVAVKVKNDTVEYDVTKFKRLEDRKIINVLKNMPGIQVDERIGLIQYKGKPIETLLLDGDNLFGKSYSIGARNISSDIVDKVEAIEDYHDNKLKKGLKKSDKVVLNLKFKKDKFKVSGEVAVGGGKDSHLVNANIINLSSDIKGFGVFNFNNISVNQTPFQKETYAIENREEIENATIDFFNESSITQTSIFPRSYINNIKFGSISNLLKVTDKIKIKNAISYFNDNYQYSFLSRNNIEINNEAFLTSNKTSNSAIPIFISMANEVDIDLSNNSILKYSNRIVDNKNDFDQINLQNEENVFETQINHSKLYYQQNLSFTKKISNNNLIELNIFNSNDFRKQSIDILNQEDIFFNGNIFNNESFDNRRNIFFSDILYLKKMDNWNFEFIVRHRLDTENFKINTISNRYDYQFKNNTTNFITTTNFEKNKKFRLTGKIDIGFSKRELQNDFDNVRLNQDDFFVNSEFKMKFKFDSKSNLSLNFENKNKLNDNYYLFSNPILIDSRTITSNISSLEFQKRWKTYINFSHYDLLRQSSFTFLSSYEEIKNSIVAEQEITEDINIITYFQIPQNRKDINLLASKTFFVDYIDNKISLNSNANFSRYFNALNGSDISQVWSAIYNTNIEINSAFKGFFNYKSNIGITYIENKQENSNTFFNSTLNARLEAIFQFTKKSYSKIENELLLPRGNGFDKNQLFIDFSFNHKGKNIEYFILSRNLLNKSSFNQISVTEFSTSVFSSNLFDRYIIFGLNYNF